MTHEQEPETVRVFNEASGKYEEIKPITAVIYRDESGKDVATHDIEPTLSAGTAVRRADAQIKNEASSS